MANGRVVLVARFTGCMGHESVTQAMRWCTLWRRYNSNGLRYCPTQGQCDCHLPLVTMITQAATDNNTMHYDISRPRG